MAFLFWYLMKQRNTLAKYLLLYFFICLIFILIKWRLSVELGTYDAQLYQSLATTISSQLHKDFLPNLPNIFLGYSAYTVPLGFLYFIFGNSEVVGQLFSTMFGLGVLYNLHQLALACFNRKVANLTTLCLTLYPYGWILATTLNRDIPVAFFITLLFRMLAEAQNGQRNFSRKSFYVIVLGCIAYLTLLRPPLLLLCGLTVSIYLLIQKRGLFTYPNIFRPIKTLLLSLLIMALAITAFWGKDYFASFRLTGQAVQFISLDNLNRRLASSEDAGSAYMTGMRYASARDILTIMPLATAYFMYSPFPWQVQSPKQALGLLDSTLMLVLTYYFLKGIKDLYRRRRKLTMVLVTFLLVGFCTSSLLQSNIGAAMRHRTMFFLLMIPMAAHGFQRAPNRIRLVYPVSPAALPAYSLRKEGNSYD